MCYCLWCFLDMVSLTTNQLSVSIARLFTNNTIENQFMLICERIIASIGQMRIEPNMPNYFFVDSKIVH